VTTNDTLSFFPLWRLEGETQKSVVRGLSRFAILDLDMEVSLIGVIASNNGLIHSLCARGVWGGY